MFFRPKVYPFYPVGHYSLSCSNSIRSFWPGAGCDWKASNSCWSCWVVAFSCMSFEFSSFWSITAFFVSWSISSNCCRNWAFSLSSPVRIEVCESIVAEKYYQGCSPKIKTVFDSGLRRKFRKKTPSQLYISTVHLIILVRNRNGSVFTVFLQNKIP